MDREEQPTDRRAPAIEPGVKEASSILRRHEIRFVIVGGQAIARDAATATRDVDVMVTTGDYATTIARLAKDNDLTLALEGGAVTRFGMQTLRGIPLDVIDAGVFAGTKSGKEFFDFLVGHECSEADGVLYASPEMVWYTRLMTKRWRAYAEKIVTNVIDGISSDRLAKVEAIGRRFGTEATIKERIAYVRDELGRGDLDPLLRRP